MSSRPKLLVADPHPASRLTALDALRDDYEVVPMPEDDDPLRATRHHRPAVLLLAVPAARASAALRACRSLKTEANPPRVALLDRLSRLEDPDDALTSWLADGVLQGPADGPAVRRFVSDVVAGRRPVVRSTAGKGLLGRLFGR